MRRLTFRNPRILRSSSEENVLFIGLADPALSTYQINGGLLSRCLLEDAWVSFCDSEVMGLSRSLLYGGMIYGRELSLLSMMVGDCAGCTVLFAVGAYIFRFESKLIAGVAACSNMSWDILSPFNTWNRFSLMLTRSTVTLPFVSGSRIPSATSTLCLVTMSVRSVIRLYRPGEI